MTISNSSHRFQYAYCQVQELKKLKSTAPKYVKLTLDALPTTLDETYTRILLDIDEMYYQHAFTLLQWLTYAESPLTLGQLVEAAVIDPAEESSVDVDNRGGLEDALNILSGLVAILDPQEASVKVYNDAEFCGLVSLDASLDHENLAHQSQTPVSSTRIRLAHFSFKEYLESNRILKSTAHHFHLESTIGHRFLAHSCITYLRYYSALKEPDSKIRSDCEVFPLVEYAAQSWHRHSQLQQGGDHNREFAFLQLDKARADWLKFDNPDDNFGRSGNERPGATSSLYCASLLGLEGVVSDLLRSGVDANIQGGPHGFPLIVASRQGHNEVVKLLLDHGADINANTPGRSKGHTALRAASLGFRNATIAVVRLLLERGADIDAQSDSEGTALHEAVGVRNTEIARLLLEKGARLDIEQEVVGTALHIASRNGSKDLVQLLLESGANINAPNEHYGTPLQAASWGYDTDTGCPEVVRLLLENGADVNDRSGRYGSALQAASIRGNRKIAELLLRSGADLHAQGGQYGSVFRAAAKSRSIELMQLLLERTAIVKARHKHEMSPLHLAISRNDTTQVQVLLQNRASVCVNCFTFVLMNRKMDMVALFLPHLTKTLASKRGKLWSKTILHWAAEIGCEDTTQRCLDLRASVHAQDAFGETPLHYAAENGHLEVCRRLVHAGSRLDVLDSHQRTPLGCARGEGPGTNREPHSVVADYLVSCSAGTADTNSG